MATLPINRKQQQQQTTDYINKTNKKHRKKERKKATTTTNTNQHHPKGWLLDENYMFRGVLYTTGWCWNLVNAQYLLIKEVQTVEQAASNVNL